MVNLVELEPEQYLNGAEQSVMAVGWEAMRPLLVEQWRLTDQALVARFRQEQARAISRQMVETIVLASITHRSLR